MAYNIGLNSPGHPLTLHGCEIEVIKDRLHFIICFVGTPKKVLTIAAEPMCHTAMAQWNGHEPATTATRAL